MTRKQKLELIRIGAAGQSPRFASAVAQDTHEERVLKALGMIEVVPESGFAIFKRKRPLLRLTDAGLIAFAEIMVDAVDLTLKIGDAIVGAANDTDTTASD